MRHIIRIEVINIKNSEYKYIGHNDLDEKILFSHSFKNSNEGITEFIGAVHGLMYIHKQGINGEVRVKTQYIKESIEKREYNHTVKGPDSEKTNELLTRAKRWIMDKKSSFNIFLIEDVSDEFMKRKNWYKD